MNTLNASLLRRNKITVPANSHGTTSQALIASFNSNLQELGYSLSPTTIARFKNINETDAVRLFNETIEILKELRGVKNYKPMYPNFPKQVMEASEAELYINALIHYISSVIVDVTGNPDNIWLPNYAKEKGAFLKEKTLVTVLNYIDEDGIKDIAKAIATSNTSLSESDKEDLRVFKEAGYLVLPERIPNKENLSVVASLFINDSLTGIASYFKTATDVLRLAVALSGGDVSLAKPTKFRNFNRKERKFLLGLLNQVSSLEEDMPRWKERWLRLGEKIHPGDFASRFDKAYRAFSAIRSGTIETIRTHIEEAVRGGNTFTAVSLLSTRPGDFARRLDHLLRQTTKKRDRTRVVSSFLSVAKSVSTPVLLQVMNHFQHRDDLRVVFPKGNAAKVMSLDKELPSLPDEVKNQVVNGISTILTERFSSLSSLGNVYIDPKLKDCLVPFAQRSASKSLRTLVRGSKLPLEGNKNTIRFFVWWKDITSEGGYQSNGRVDIDLSATILDEDWNYVEALTYYNLRGDFGCHSGDITSAPKGASEFIDINIDEALKRGRYVVMTVHSFTGQKLSDIPECSAGFMMRKQPQSGEVYDPRTVVDRMDVASSSTSGIPLIIDLKERKVIWADVPMLSLEGNRYGYYSYRGRINNVYTTKGTIQLLGKALTQVHKPNLYDLLKIHAKARGNVILDKNTADTIFSVENGTPFEIEKIASEYLSDVK